MLLWALWQGFGQQLCKMCPNRQLEVRMKSPSSPDFGRCLLQSHRRNCESCFAQACQHKVDLLDAVIAHGLRHEIGLSDMTQVAGALSYLCNQQQHARSQIQKLLVTDRIPSAAQLSTYLLCDCSCQSWWIGLTKQQLHQPHQAP